MSPAGSRESAGSRLREAAAIALASAAIVSCGFIGADMFPKELQYAEGDYDLAAEFDCEPNEIGDLNIESLRSSAGASGVFVAANRTDGWHLTVLDGRMDRAASLQDPAFSRFLGSSSGIDGFICGRTSMSADYSLNITGMMVGCRDDCIDVPMTDYVIEWQGGSASLVDLSLKAGGSTAAVATPLAEGLLFMPLDGSALYAGSATPRFFLLARSASGGDALCLGFPDASASLLANMDGTPLISNAQISATWIHGDYIDGGWVTDDGVVLLVHGRDSRLARFALGSGEELDSLRVGSDWMKAVCFDDAGEYWYYYDRGSGRVKRLRTWWR